MKKNEISRVIRSAAVWLTVVAVVVCITCFVVGCARGSKESEPICRAIVRLPDGVIMEGYADDYYRGSNGWIEITMDGSTYGTHVSNVVIIEDSDA